MPTELAEPAPGCLPTEWALVIVGALCTFMILSVVARGRWPKHHDVSLWLGGLLLFTSMFFTLGYGPWGAQMSGYAALTWNWGFPDILYVLPVVTPYLIGAVVWIAAFLAIHSTRSITKKVQWRIVGVTAAAIPIVWLATVLWLRFTTVPPGQPTMDAVWLTASIAVVTHVVLAAPLLLSKSDVRRNAWVHMLTAALLLLWTSVNLVRSLKSGTTLATAGIGYWMHVGGLIVILAGGVCEALAKIAAPSGHSRNCGYNLTGLTRDNCPECGTVIPLAASAAALRAAPVARHDVPVSQPQSGESQ